jgi:carbamoylphosphate synthase small subunit
MIYEKLPFDMPKLGICRGGQFLTVMNGGKMIQDVNNHSGNHKITHVGSGQVYEITSTHHQMMFPFNLPDHRFELVAHSQYFQSTKYLNGNDEEFDLPKDFLEPEIIYYPESNSLCIQGHPEYNHCPEKTKQWCFKLMDMYLFKTISIPPKKEESYNRSKPLPIKPFIESKNPFSQNTYKTPEVLIKKKG